MSKPPRSFRETYPGSWEINEHPEPIAKAKAGLPTPDGCAERESPLGEVAETLIHASLEANAVTDRAVQTGSQLAVCFNLQLNIFQSMMSISDP